MNVQPGDNSTALFYVKANGPAYLKGNVGIGTTAPSYKLDVSGTLRADDYYSGDGTQGFTGTCADGTSLTVKDGLITGCS